MNEDSSSANADIPPGIGQSEIDSIALLIKPDEGQAATEKPAPAAPAPDGPADDAAPNPEGDELPAAAAPDAPASVDYELLIPIGPGHEDATLGTLKDFYKENQDWQTERTEWDNTRSAQENEQMVVRQEVTKLVQLLGDVKPEVMAQLQTMNKVNAATEQALLLQVRPEWSDPDVKQTASTAMLETAKEYGFSSAEYNAIDDHKVIKLLDDFTKLKAQAAAGKAARIKAQEASKLSKPAERKVVISNDSAAIDRAKAGDDNQKAAFVSTLIQ